MSDTIRLCVQTHHPIDPGNYEGPIHCTACPEGTPCVTALYVRLEEVNDLRDQVQMYEEKAERDWRDFGEMQDARIAADDRVRELEAQIAACPEDSVSYRVRDRDSDYKAMCHEDRDHAELLLKAWLSDGRDAVIERRHVFDGGWSPVERPFFTEQQERALARCEGYDEGYAASPDERLREAGELERFLSTMAFVLPNLNDTFAFACADTEKISVGDGKLLADFWRRHGWRGLVAIAAVKRKAQPLAEVAATPEFQAAYAELLAGEQHPDEDGEPWTLADEFEIDGQADALAAADREAPDPSVSPDQEETRDD